MSASRTAKDVGSGPLVRLRKFMTTEKATIQDYISCAARLARALRTTPFYECHQLNHAGGKYHKRDEPCPVCRENEAALLELERLSRLPVELPNEQADAMEGAK